MRRGSLDARDPLASVLSPSSWAHTDAPREWATNGPRPKAGPIGVNSLGVSFVTLSVAKGLSPGGPSLR